MLEKFKTSSALALIALGVLVSWTYAQETRVPPPSGWADTVLLNGKIATMNDAQKFVEAIAIRDGRIAALGGNQEIRKFAGPKTKIIDLKGKTVVPGLISAHDHPHLWISWFHDTGSKVNPQWASVPAIGNTPEEAADAIKRTVEKAVEQRKPGEWILIRTDEDGDRALRTGLITRADLDRLAPQNPVIVRTEYIDVAVSKNGKVLNTIEAVEKAYRGFGPPLRSAARAMIINSKAEGILGEKGMLEGASATGTTGDIMLELIPELAGLDAFAEAIRRELQFWAEAEGVTTTITTWFRRPSVVTAHSMLAKQKKLPGRVAWYTAVNQHDFGGLEGVGDDYYWNVGVEYEGVVLEEALASAVDPSLWGTEIGKATTYASKLTPKDPRLQKVKEKIIDDALRAEPGEPGREMILKWLRSGVRVGDVHCYSDGAIDMFIDIAKQLQRETGWSEEKIRKMRNFYLTHLALVRPEQIPELKRWGMIVGPSWRTMFDLPRLKIAYGEEVKKYIWPVKSLLEAGVPVAANVDMSPTVGEEGEGMWDILEFLVTREYAGETWNEKEAVDRWTALKTVTIYGAYTALRENELGSLEVGKLADLVVLDKDYFTIPAKQIGTIRPLLTMVGGRTVYQSLPEAGGGR